MTVDGSGNLFIGDSNNNRVRRVDAFGGIITTVPGNGAVGLSGTSPGLHHGHTECVIPLAELE